MTGSSSDSRHWRDLIQQIQAPAPVVIAEIFVTRIGSLWEPALFECDDGHEYFVKGSHSGRILMTEQVVARIGAAIGAPVAEVSIIDVPLDLVRLNPRLADFGPGLSHGSRRISDAYDSREVWTYDSPENLQRFARLAVLYGLFMADDHQFLYENAMPHLVWSFDHSEFLPGGSDWSVFSLNSATGATFDGTILRGASVPREALSEAAGALSDLSDETIAAAVAAAPDSWGVTLEERIALAGYIASRRATLMILASSYAS